MRLETDGLKATTHHEVIPLLQETARYMEYSWDNEKRG